MPDVKTDVFSLDNLDVFMRPGAKIEKREDGNHAGCWVTLNGWVLSIQWGTGNYSDNYNRGWDATPSDSRTAEIAVWKEGSRADLVAWGLDPEWGDTVQAYVSMARVQHVLDLIERDELVREYQPPRPPLPPAEMRAVDDFADPTQQEER